MMHITPEEVRRGVLKYNEEWDEREVHELSRKALLALHSGEPSEAVLRFTRKVNSWGRTRTRTDTWSYAQHALTTLPWAEIRELEPNYSAERAEYVADLCERVVEGILQRGGKRREYSYASKLLHWLWPEQVPVNDTYVRQEWLGIEDQGRGPYLELVGWMFERAAQLAPFESEVVGDVAPKTLLRAIDKAVWWEVARRRG